MQMHGIGRRNTLIILLHAKQAGESYINRIIMCQHPHVYTLGRSGKAANMLLSDEHVATYRGTLFHIDRGGDITYHGPRTVGLLPHS